MQREIESLSAEIDEINEQLRVLHLREAVLKSRLGRAVDRKCQLIDTKRNQSRQASTRSGLPHTVPVSAVVVEDIKSDRSSAGNSTRGARNTSEVRERPHINFRGKTTRNAPVARDRDGVIISVGDEVKFLTRGVNKSDFGQVRKITNKFVHCLDNCDELTKRYPRNLRITDKYHEC